jgi:hypothetical protein
MRTKTKQISVALLPKLVRPEREYSSVEPATIDDAL